MRTEETERLEMRAIETMRIRVRAEQHEREARLAFNEASERFNLRAARLTEASEKEGAARVALEEALKEEAIRVDTDIEAADAREKAMQESRS